MKTLMAVLLLAVTVNAQEAQYELLHSFSGPPDGALPNGSPILSGATLYGTAAQAGSNGGVVFSIETNGLNYAVLHSFSSTGTLAFNGVSPVGTLLLLNSTLFGTTLNGGTNGNGVLFRMETNGANFQVVHQFGGPEGSGPRGAVIHDGNALYGMTTSSGGGIYKINPDGSGLQVLRSFNFSPDDGFTPYKSLLRDGANLYGMTTLGGSNGNGVVFSILTNGANFKILHNFQTVTNNGSVPRGSLARVGATLFGTTQSGGANGAGTVFSIRTNGTSFKLLHSFNGADGSQPFDDVTVFGSTLFGLNTGNGTDNAGTAFSLSTNGSNFQILHTFIDEDGKSPQGSLVFTNNVLYGFATQGGTSINRGAIYSLTLTNELPIEFACALTPALATNIVGNAHTVTATVTSNDLASVGALVNFAVIAGPNLGQTGTATTDASGQGSFTYTGNTVGTDSIRAISLGVTGIASTVWISTNAPPVTRELAVIKMKAPKKITLSEKKPNVIGKFSVSIQNNSTNTATIADIGTLANLVTLNVQSLGGCTNPAAVLVTPKFGFPFQLAPKKKLNLAYTAVISCANAPTAKSNDYQVTATVHAAVLGGVDSVPANDVCPRAPFGTDKGCGGKGGTDVFIDVIVK